MDRKETGQLNEQWGKFRKEINRDFAVQVDQIEQRVKTHIGVLVENFDDKVKLIAEQHLSIMRVLENHTRQLKAIAEKLIDVDIRLGRVEDQLKRKVDYEEFQGLLKRVALLESRVGRKA